MMPRIFFLALFAVALPAALCVADEKPADGKPGDDKPADDAPPAWVAKIAAAAKPSVVVITVSGRDGSEAGIGTGFIVRADGLVATNLHVIGEARPIAVRTHDGRSHEVIAVEAADRLLDLALLRIAAKGLPALALGDSDRLKQGDPVAALGNPHGLEHSVVAGVVSGSRLIDGVPMIQLAMPIEPGNSGGPVLDAAGRVQGITTLKSAVTDNLGFAVKINALKPLLEKPNPVPMNRWLTIGALDPDQWTTLYGARWRQRAGRILVEGSGDGFGGRALCLAKHKPPAGAFELAVAVKLDDEAGAAGLVFGSDGHDRHFGFYPSAGHLRLTRFDGPDVFSWHVLREETSPAYRAGDWNVLKVRVEPKAIRCWVNDQFLLEEPLEEAAGGPTVGSVGVAKFRDTQAEFRHFAVAAKLPPTGPSAEVAARIARAIDRLPTSEPIPSAALADLRSEPAEASIAALRHKADALDERAAALRALAARVHEQATTRRLAAIMARPEDKIDLVEAALWIARLDNDDLDVEAYRQQVDRMAREIRGSLKSQAGADARRAALDRYLFAEHGFHGSRGNYYHQANSYLNEVLDDREGLPITLAILYLELGRRLDLKVEGLGLPGHFMVRYTSEQGEPQFIDVFDAGRTLDRQQVAAKVLDTGGVELQDEYLRPTAKRAIITRLLRNLMSIAERGHDTPAVLRYADAIVAADPDAATERLIRAVLLARANRPAEAQVDTAWLLEHAPEGIDTERVQQLHELIQAEIAK
jgi:regulator of sirC expression with transglutaminase-like and TPR domain/S1-C subfamily serine protease